MTGIHHWFWEPVDLGGHTTNNLIKMIDIQRDTVARVMTVMVVEYIHRRSTLQSTTTCVTWLTVEWARNCHDTPLTTTSGNGDVCTLTLSRSAVFDRFQLQEETVMICQRVRRYMY